MRDPYDVLGVPRGASAGAIKSAFRKLAKKLHPDANKNDPKAAARFAEANAAYEILGDENKRKAFDAGEIDAEGKPRFSGFEGVHPGGFGPGGARYETFTWGPEGFQRGGPSGHRQGGFGGGIDDILKEMMGGFAGARPRRGAADDDEFAGMRGQDVNVPLTVSLNDLAGAAPMRVRLPTGKEVEVRLPAGLTDGQQIRLKGQGFAGPAGTGDALITIAIAKHPLFAREGDDLRLDLPVSLYEAVLGAKVRVPTLDGAVELAIPANSGSGKVLRVKGKGLPGKAGRGDLYATIRIVLPDSPDEELEALMRQWRERKPYDPRRDMS